MTCHESTFKLIRHNFNDVLLRRNASTNVRKTYLIERYILHWKPNHTIYVRYFSILLYLLNVQVAPTENKTSLKLWRISLNVLSWQVIFMLSITIEKKIFKVNCLYKTRDSFYWKYAPFFHILNDDMYMMLSVCCFWIFNKKNRCVKSWVRFFSLP
jgi:hypothetical protein